MRIIFYVFLLFVPISTLAQSYLGEIDSVKPVGETIVIDGVSYKYNNNTNIRINRYLGSVENLGPGARVKYQMKQLANGQRYLTEIVVSIPDSTTKNMKLEH